jgi:hypothetical protein
LPRTTFKPTHRSGQQGAHPRADHTQVCSRWSENVPSQFFIGMDHDEHRLPCDRTQIGRIRSALGEEGLEELLKAHSCPQGL